jgi:O-antigen ligase
MLYNLLSLFFLYIPFQLALNASEDFDLASGRVFTLLLGILWLFKSLAQKRLFIPNKIQTLLLFSFLFLNVFSLFFAQNQEWAYRKILFLFSFLPLYFIVADYFSDPLNNKEISPKNTNKKSLKLVEFLSYGAGLISLVGIIQFSLQFFLGIKETLKLWESVVLPFLGNSFSQTVFDYPSWLVGVSGSTYMRAIAFFPDPHMFSFFLGMILPWSIGLIFQSEKKAGKYVFLIISLLIFSADILTFSRGGYLGLLSGLFFALFLFRKYLAQKFSVKKVAVFSAGIIFFLIAILVPNPISQRLGSSFSLNEGSNEERMKNWKESLEIIQNNPWGVGIGNYSFTVKPASDYREPIYSHNLYLDIAAEIGILGFLIFLWLILSSIFSFLKLGAKNKFFFAGAISLAIFSVHSIFETPLFSIHIFPLFLILIAFGAKSFHPQAFEKNAKASNFSASNQE